MSLVPGAIEALATELGRLPGIGPKTAQRLAFFVVSAPDDLPAQLAEALTRLRGVVHPCARCFFIAEEELCAVCRDPRRDRTTLCVVEEALDVLAIERSGEFRGLYHVLEGSLSPIEGIGPAQLRLAELEARLDGEVTEVVIATDPDVEGEATAHYIAERLEGRGARVTRLAHGLPAGADLRYADEVTVARAFTGRRGL